MVILNGSGRLVDCLVYRLKEFGLLSFSSFNSCSVFEKLGKELSGLSYSSINSLSTFIYIYMPIPLRSKVGNVEIIMVMKFRT